MRIVQQSANLISCTSGAQELIERAGRTCYRSADKVTTSESAGRFCRMLIERGHESVLEHASATFRLVTNRAIANELTRHRTGIAFSQESTRYVDASRIEDGIEIVMPHGLSTASFEYTVFMGAAKDACYAYDNMRACGIKPEVARDVLPLALKTELVATANFREWRHILKLRLDKAAHPQMRELMNLVRMDLMLIAPDCFSNFAPQNQ